MVFQNYFLVFQIDQFQKFLKYFIWLKLNAFFINLFKKIIIIQLKLCH